MLVLLAIAAGPFQKGIIGHIPRKAVDCAAIDGKTLLLTTPASAIRVTLDLTEIQEPEDDDAN